MVQHTDPVLERWKSKNAYVKITLNAKKESGEFEVFAGFLKHYNSDGITISLSHIEEDLVWFSRVNILYITLWGKD